MVEPTTPTSPLSPRSQLDAFFQEHDDVLEWTAEWEQRSSNMDQKHVEVMCSQWRLMRESATEHSQILHQMKKAMHELRANGMTLEDRLSALESKLRDDMGREQTARIDDLEKRLRERIRQEQDAREADLAELRDLLKAGPGQMAALKQELQREQQARLDDLEQRLFGRLRFELDAQGAEVAAVRDLVKDGLGSMEALKGDIARDVAERLEDLEARISERLAEAAAAQARGEAVVHHKLDDLERHLGEQLKVEREDREAGLAAVGDLAKAAPQQLEVLREVVVKDHGERLDELERRLREALRAEQDARAAEVENLRSLLEAAPAKLDARCLALEDMIARERVAREAGLDTVQQLLAKEAEVLSGVKAYITDEAAARERGDAALQDRLRAAERVLADALERVAAEAAELGRVGRRQGEEIQSLGTQLGDLQDKLDKALQGINLEEVLELIAREKLNRESDFATLQQAVEQTLEDFQGKVEGVQTDLQGEKSERQHRLEALRSWLQEQLQDQKSTIEGRVETLLVMLQDSSSAMVHSWADHAAPAEPTHAKLPVEKAEEAVPSHEEAEEPPATLAAFTPAEPPTATSPPPAEDLDVEDF